MRRLSITLRVVSRLLLLIGSTQTSCSVSAQDLPPAPDVSVATPKAIADLPEEQTVESQKKPHYDARVVARGQSAFQASCTSCHDANLALSKQKSLKEWRNTVRRMAAKDGANVPDADWESIAIYLTSLRQSEVSTSDSSKDGEDSVAERFSVNGTLSPLFRGSGADIQNRGFFPEAWLGVAYQSKGFVSARVTACLTCHTGSDYMDGNIDLVEAAVRFDLTQIVEPRCRGNWKASVDAGRFIVPFGAFSSQVNPGVFRTVSKPLIFNMGMRALDSQLGDTVLPMPYADTGANLHLGVPVTETINATWDGYVVNGLQGDRNGINFDASTSYFDNNRSPALGSRVTAGNQFLKFGSSITGGHFADDPAAKPLDSGLVYMILGADMTLRYEDRIRVQCEYAQRETDRVLNPKDFPSLSHVTVDNEMVGGGYVEAEALILRKYKISALVRYDDQARHGFAPPPGSSLTMGSYAISRFTWGFNWTLPGGSLLMLNHEYWYVPKSLPNVNVVGLRWAATF